MVVQEVPDCELTIIGSGPLNDSIHQLVRDPDVGGCVQFRRDVSDSELMRCYEDADMFILPGIIVENGDRDVTKWKNQRCKNKKTTNHS
jgi:glycosyltransferase involved in cell wall biosynthesis